MSHSTGTQPNRNAVEAANLALLERYHQRVWVEKDTGAGRGFMSSGFKSHSAPDALPGGEAVGAFLASFFAAIPDLKSETLFNLADGDKVVTAWVLTGTHSGQALFGTPASGRAIKVSGIDVLRVEGDRFAEHWFGLGLVMPYILQQLGPGVPESHQ